MSLDLVRLVQRFVGQRVLVVGDAMLDTYVYGTAGRLCQEAPVPVVAVGGREDAPGGSANTAANAAALGASVSLLAVTGEDAEGVLLRQRLGLCGVDTANLKCDPGRRTLSKSRVVVSGQLLLRFDQGSTGPVEDSVERWLVDRLTALFPRSDAVLVSDYGYGVLTPTVRKTLAALQRTSPRVLVIDAKNLAAYRDAGATAVKPNCAQAMTLLGVERPTAGEERIELIRANGERILDATGAGIAAVTMDVDGALLFERCRPAYRTFARASSQGRAAGAGDTFMSALALSFAAGASMELAAEVASAAAAVVVARDGTSVCHGDDLTEQLAGADRILLDRPRLVFRLEFYRRQGRRIVFTNGCFDILHRGHVAYLSQARALGDVLVVGLNTDDSVRRLKGSARPINPLEDRAHVLAALSCVDHVIPFHEDTPAELIRLLRPEVFVKGADYARAQLPEATVVESYGGRVQILPYVDDRSTTDIIERIRRGQRRPNGDVLTAPAGA